MTFDAILDQVLDLLQREGRVSYRALKLRFNINDDYIEGLKDELIYAKKLAVDEDGRVLVWTGGTSSTPTTASPVLLPAMPDVAPAQVEATPGVPHTPEAERRQLTVMFCDLVDSTKLSAQLDPEEYRDVVRAYQRGCSEVITRFDGHIAQLLGDGLLVYFGYPQVHEDDAQRAVRAGLGILNATGDLKQELQQTRGIQLALRIGIHTGLVVVGAMGGQGRQEQLALGETPNVAARIQGLVVPNAIAISEVTYHLVQGYFQCQDLGAQVLRGVTESMHIYHVLSESGATSRLEVAQPRGLTPLVGRDAEVTLLLERWQQAKAGHGQVVLLSGEAGIGKSRLIQTLKDHVAHELHTCWECRSAEYYQNTALFPLTDLFQRLLQFQAEDTPDAKLEKLAHALSRYRLPLEDTVPLFAPLLALPVPDHTYPPLNLSPQRQRQKTLETLVAILLELAERQPVLFIVEDIHWTDPTTLEWLHLLIDQIPTTSILMLLTCRPHFQPSWHHQKRREAPSFTAGMDRRWARRAQCPRAQQYLRSARALNGRRHCMGGGPGIHAGEDVHRSYITEMTLNHLSHAQVAQIVAGITNGQTLPTEVLQQIVAKTDGVPLFVEELTKAILESGHLKEVGGHYELIGSFATFAIPATLQDSLMARLDRLVTAKGIAQFGATIGRQFSYALLQAVAQLNDRALQEELHRLVEAELLYQRGVPPQATYTFKHALIQDAAYQSLLRSSRQHYHQRIAQVLEFQFPESAETQPELLAHHYTEAGFTEKAVHYWHQAGQSAVQHSAYVEAIAHLRQGLALLQTLPETPVRTRREVDMLLALGASLHATKSIAAPEVEQTFIRAQHLCQHLDEPQRLFPVLRGLWNHNNIRGEYQTAYALGEQLLTLAQQSQDPALLVVAHRAVGTTLFWMGAVASAQTHFAQGIALYDPTQHRTSAFLYGEDAGVACHSYAAWTLWSLGYPAQALARSQEAVTLAQQRAHPFSLAFALSLTAQFHQFRREVRWTQERAEAAMTLAQEQGFLHWRAVGCTFRGWALAQQAGQAKEGIEQLTQGLRALHAIGVELRRPYYLALLAEAHGTMGQPEEGLALLTEALTLADTRGERWCESELYRLKGKLLLQQNSDNQADAESCFHHAIEIARTQQAKSLELRAVMSLSRLWQQQGKRKEAHDLLGSVCHWFTEGFDTADLQDAKALLDELA